MGQGYILTGICESVHRGVVILFWVGALLLLTGRGQPPSLGQIHRHQTAIAEDATHPTVMHYC